MQVFNKDGVLKRDTDFVDNLITSSGLLFPTGVAYADCFRYLSVGSSNAAATLSDTGPVSPISDYQFMGPYRIINDLGFGIIDGTWPDYTYYVPEGCGTTVTDKTVELFRTWRIPSGDLGVPSAVTIRELSVSPSAPIETGIQYSGRVVNVGSIYSGNYYLPFAVKPFHTGAFSRVVVGNVDLSTNDYALISYKLIVSPQTEPTAFSLRLDNSTFSTGDSFAPACFAWTGQLSGYASLIHAGIKLISSSSFPTNQGTPNEFHGSLSKTFYSPEGANYYGISYTPIFGAPMEPSANTGFYVAYMSSDNLQFVANPSGGAVTDTTTGVSGTFFPYNINGRQSSGVCGYTRVIPTGGSTVGKYLNIRSSNYSSLTPSPTNIAVPQTTIGVTGKHSIFRPPSTSSTSRGFTVDWFNFNTSYRAASVVLGIFNSQYVGPDYTNVYPFFDMVLNTTGQGIMPVPFLATPTNVTGVYTVNPDGPLFIDGFNNITLQFQLSWSA